MSETIIERLRRSSKTERWGIMTAPLMDDAADEIVRLRAEVELYREALGFYEREAGALARYAAAGNGTAIEATLVVLTNDGGSRARRALTTEETSE